MELAWFLDGNNSMARAISNPPCFWCFAIDSVGGSMACAAYPGVVVNAADLFGKVLRRESGGSLVTYSAFLQDMIGH